MLTPGQLETINSQDLTLRTYQSEVISRVCDRFAAGNVSVLLYAPTGAGKTIIAAKIIADWVNQGKRVLFLVHRGKLVHQTREKLSTYFGIEPSVIWRDFFQPDYANPVQIAMLQTLQNRELPPDIDLVILDEAHTGSYYKIWQKIMLRYSGGIFALSKTKFLGLSASPWRSKIDQGYCQFFQAVIRAPNPKELIEMGHLCRARQFGYTGLIDESKLKVVDGEFTEDSMRSVCTPALNQEIINIYLQRDSQLERKLIAFCANVAQAKNLAEQFCSAGVRAECIVGETPEEERNYIFEQYREGKIQLISSVGVLCEGFDEPSVSAVLVCRPVKSKALWVQMNGRGLRPFTGKEDCWFLDFCGNLKRLGLPTDSYAIDLCPGNKIKGIAPEPISTKECDECKSWVAAYEKICPHCGHVFGSDKNKVKATKRKFEEILSPEQKRQFRFLKVRAVNAYNKCKSVDNLDDLFHEQFNYSPPVDWYDGLIFENKLDTWEINVQHYWRYLLEITPNPGSKASKEQIQGLIKREFKSAIQKTTERFQKLFAQDGLSFQELDVRVDERISSLISYKPWWTILELNSPPDANYLDFAYRQCRFKYESRFALKPEILQAQMELIGIAIAEGIEYHSQDVKVIEKSIATVRHAIQHQSFAFVKSFVGRLSSTAKLRVWNGLTQAEKIAYRRWQENNSVELKEDEDIPTPAINPISKVEVKPQNYRDDGIDRDKIFQILNGEVNRTHAAVNSDNSAPVIHQPSLTIFPERTAYTPTPVIENPNPENFRIGEKVASNKPDSPAFHWCGRITRMHPTNPEVCYVNYPERKTLLNLNTTEISCRFEDLRRI